MSQSNGWVSMDEALIRLISAEAMPPEDAAISPSLPNLRCVVYRTGGTSNFKWQRTEAVWPEEAARISAELDAGGYVNHIENFFSSMSIGLPETYAPDFPLITEWT